jgi:hypothetical protein
MKMCFTVALFGLFGCACCEIANHAPGHITEHEDKRQLCSLLIASHRSILESMFEVELYAVSDQIDEWHGALKSLDVPTRDSGGHPRNPSSVLQSTLDKLARMENAADRMRLEYLLLGSRMSLEERRQFEAYCVARGVAD